MRSCLGQPQFHWHLLVLEHFSFPFSGFKVGKISQFISDWQCQRVPAVHCTDMIITQRFSGVPHLPHMIYIFAWDIPLDPHLIFRFLGCFLFFLILSSSGNIQHVFHKVLARQILYLWKCWNVKNNLKCCIFSALGQVSPQACYIVNSMQSVIQHLMYQLKVFLRFIFLCCRNLTNFPLTCKTFLVLPCSWYFFKSSKVREH